MTIPPLATTPPLQLQSLPPRRGAAWVQRGFQQFLRRPMGYTLLFLSFLFVALFVMSLPWVGQVLVMMALPLLSLAFMVGTRGVLLSVLLYAQCFRLLLSLAAHRRRLRAATGRVQLHRLQEELRESFRRQRGAIGPMIAAAPLLGLLGTVSGMEKTFGSLSTATGGKSMEGLAGGISEVLVATESGLTVALPAMLLVYVAHREMHRLVTAANQLDRVRSPAGGAS